MSKLRFGIVGVGMMGREHIRNLKLHPEAEIVALQDPEGESRRLGIKQLGHDVPTFETVEDMLAKAELDCVLVVSPNFTHREVLKPLFAAGLNILCEKPLCTTVDDARWAAEQALKHKAVFWTGMEYRFMPPAARFIDAIKAGDVGRLVQLSIREHRFPFLVKVGDVLEIRDKSKSMAIVLEALQSQERETPDYIDVDPKGMTAKYSRIPQLSDVPYAVQMEPNLVVEYYAS